VCRRGGRQDFEFFIAACSFSESHRARSRFRSWRCQFPMRTATRHPQLPPGASAGSKQAAPARRARLPSRSQTRRPHKSRAAALERTTEVRADAHRCPDRPLGAIDTDSAPEERDRVSPSAGMSSTLQSSTVMTVSSIESAVRRAISRARDGLRSLVGRADADRRPRHRAATRRSIRRIETPGTPSHRRGSCGPSHSRHGLRPR
jgi:hypothetical protein